MRAHTLAITLWAGLTLAAAAAAPVRGDSERRIVVPLIDMPFEHLADRTSSTSLNGDTAAGWLTANAAWLVLDPDWRGEVRSGDDMIADGFAGLRALDGNADGELTGVELNDLSLWQDENGNGVSEAGEVLPAAVHGIAALRFTAPEGLRFEDGRTRPIYDWRMARRAS